MSPTGRKIQEEVIKAAGIASPIRIGILETPTGFEVNALHAWPDKMQNFFETSLCNFKPQITRIRAWQKNGPHSTNNPKIVDTILQQDYVYAGAGSPTYTVEHLQNSLAYRRLLEAHQEGCVLCLGSATVVAISKYTLPVYEIFKAGHKLYWAPGLDFFSKFGLKLVIIPHWNNHEGEDFDTTRCWMGKERFAQLISLLPHDVVIIGIDEQTALLFDPVNKLISVKGVGKTTIIRNNQVKEFLSESSFPFTEV